ncbi:toxin [uncultured Clostridium sp.]|uniref:toxin n=1 Tax=uncultured Clostridium sp. TaxID=59620 RepID=UPI0025F7E815|nr:toxin [uncultured Clostridium sp.]
MEKPTINYAVAYQRFRTELNGCITSLQKQYPIPNYMVEGILGSLLADVRSAVVAESVSEEQSYLKEMEDYHEKQAEALNDEITKLKTNEETAAVHKD